MKKKHYVQTEKEKEEQRRSFAFGNTSIHNPLITRKMIDEQAEKLSVDRQNKLARTSTDPS